jgi:hypothetical protein
MIKTNGVIFSYLKLNMIKYQKEIKELEKPKALFENYKSVPKTIYMVLRN